MTNPFEPPIATAEARLPTDSWRDAAGVGLRFLPAGAVASFPLFLTTWATRDPNADQVALLAAGLSIWAYCIAMAGMAGTVCWKLRGTRSTAFVSLFTPVVAVAGLAVPFALLGVFVDPIEALLVALYMFGVGSLFAMPFGWLTGRYLLPHDGVSP